MLVGQITHFLLGAFTPVAYTILDVVKVTVLGVIGYPCSQYQITIPKVAIGTAGIEAVSFRIEQGLQQMLEYILRDHSVMFPLNISSFEGDIVYFDGNWQKGDQQDAVHCVLYPCGC